MSETDAILAASTVRANAKTDQISGIPPRPLGVFRIGDVIDNGHRIKFRFTTLDTKLSGYTICYVGRVKILKKAGANNPSTNPNDGTVVLDAIRNRETGFEQYRDPIYDDTDVQADAYYTYTAFVYSDHNICNFSEPSVATIQITNNPDPFTDMNIWGFHQTFGRIPADNAITYAWEGDEYGVVNKFYNRAMTNAFSLSDYNLNNLTLGSWRYFLDEVLQNHMWEVDPTSGYPISRVIDDENGYAETEDGTDLTNGAHVLMPWINMLYYREVYDTETITITLVDGNRTDSYTISAGRSVYFTDKYTYEKFDTDEKQKWYPVGFVDFNDNTMEGIWLPGAYTDTNYSIVNCGNIATTPKKGISWNNHWTGLLQKYGQNRLVMFGTPISTILRDLEYMIFKTVNIQKAASYGNCNGGSTSRSNRIDKGYLQYDNDVFLRGFGHARNIGQTTLNPRKHTGFMFHSMVLGTYDMWLFDPYLQFTSYGYGRYTYKYKYSPEGTDYIGTFYIGYVLDSGNGDDAIKVYANSLGLISNEYGSILTRPDKLFTEHLPSFRTVAEGTSDTGMCDAFIITNATKAGSTWCESILGSRRDNDYAGPAAVSWKSVAADSFIGGDYYGSSTLMLPQPGFNPNN